ncbi:MAG: hypothetical protein IPK81_24150 [Rhodospirillales bacterium]|nr:MAG: hypothetical protein IPK81_24150 [Rhodospirillales bacterium]
MPFQRRAVWSTALLVLAAASPLAAARAQAPELCVATGGDGAACLSGGAWRTYKQADKGTLGSNHVAKIAACGEQTIFAHGSGVSALDSKGWSQHPRWGSASAESIVCAGDTLWVAHFKGVSRFQGGAWTTINPDQLASGASINDLIKSVSIAPDGAVWVATGRSVARFAKGEWTRFQQGEGFEKAVFFERLAVGPDGKVWVAGSSGLWLRDGEKWTAVEQRLGTVRAMVVDKAGRVFVGTHADGIHVYAAGAWTRHTRDKGLPSNRINALAADGHGRVWAATSYGLAVLDGDKWTVYRMDNATLPANALVDLAVFRGGPAALPKTEPTAPGSIIGRVAGAESKPVAKAKVELCVEALFAGISRVQTTPCTGQPFARSQTTDADGRFAFEDVPAGKYILAIETEPGKWGLLTSGFVGASQMIPVAAGKRTDLQTLNLRAKP